MNELLMMLMLPFGALAISTLTESPDTSSAASQAELESIAASPPDAPGPAAAPVTHENETLTDDARDADHSADSDLPLDDPITLTESALEDTLAADHLARPMNDSLDRKVIEDTSADEQGEDSGPMPDGDNTDALDGFLDEDHTAVITDFDPAEDSLRVNLDPFKAGEDFANVAVSESDGATLVHLNGELILRIEGATGLKVGFERGESFAGSSDLPQSYTDLDGNAVEGDTLDVIINNWESLVT